MDTSDLRQVPDTQEVFLYPDSGVSIIVEILQSVEPTEAADIARCELAHRPKGAMCYADFRG